MPTITEQITEKITEEIVCLRKLLDVVEQEKEVLLQGGHHKLIPLSESKLEISKSLALVQEERRNLMLSLSLDSGKPLKLGDLTEHLPLSDRKPFKKTVEKLRGMALRLKELNEANKDFVEEALDTVEHLLGIMVGANVSQNYGPKTQTQSSQLAPRLVAKEV